MKKIAVIILLVLVFGCGDEPSTPSFEQQVAQAIEVIEQNSTVLDDVIVDGHIITSPSSYQQEALTVKERHAFIDKMLLLTANDYNGTTSVFSKPYTATAPLVAATKLRDYLQENEGTVSIAGGGSLWEHLINYLEDDLLTRFDQPNGGEVILVESWSWGGTLKDPASVGMTFGKIKLKYLETSPTANTYGGSTTINAGLVHLRQTFSANEDLLLALYTPALTFIERDGGTYDQLITKIFDFTVEERAQWDHDLRMICFLSALQYITSDAYNDHNGNEYEASLETNRQILKALEVVIYAKVFELYG